MASIHYCWLTQTQTKYLVWDANAFQELFHLYVQRKVSDAHCAGWGRAGRGKWTRDECPEAAFLPGDGDWGTRRHPRPEHRTILTWFQPLLALQISVQRHYHLTRKNCPATVTPCDPVFYSISSCSITSGLGVALLFFFRSIFQDTSRDGAWLSHSLWKTALSPLKPCFPENRS